MKTNLENIAKQVSLLNRLLELLRMQEEPKPEHLLNNFETFGRWHQPYPNKRFESWLINGDKLSGIIPSFSFEDAWNHQTTQKAWSDELVAVARELSTYFKPNIPAFLFDDVIERALAVLAVQLAKEDRGNALDNLEAILKKYGRSLSE